MASPSGDDDDAYDERLFEGVRFVLVGFDDAAGSQYRSDIVRRGGVDAERLGNGCTHVIVWGLLYDDPNCVVARAQGKKVVSELWVDDSLDRGVLADADRALYWPVRDFNGIPGSESLVVCLTGFQKEYREDITKMVSLMGAKFSKPLVGNVVTHLVCYKFEGDKYELARKVHIKLANHRWLEDCLKVWKILPVDDYNKSTWELELIEAHVKDSEDEAEDTGQRLLNCGSRIMCTPNIRKGAETSVNHDVEEPMQSPIIANGNGELSVERHLNTPGHVRGAEDADIDLHHSRIKSGHASAKVDVSAPIETPCVLSVRTKNAAVRNMNSPNPIQESGVKYVGARTLDDTGDDIATPNWSVNKLDLSKANRVQHQEKDSSSGNLVAAVVRSNEKTKTNSGGDSMSKNIDNKSNSKRASQKLLAPKRRSDHQTIAHQKNEESTLRAHSNNSSLQMAQQKVLEHADIRGMESNETNTNVDAAYTQQGKNLNSPDSLKLQKKGLVPETSPLRRLFASRLSDASETVNISSVDTNPVEDIALGLEKQQSSLRTSMQSRSRKTSLKHAGSVNEGKLAEYSSCSKNVKSLSKLRTLPKAMEKNKSTTSPSAAVQEGNTSSGFSFDDMDGKNAEASASAVSQDLLLLKRESGNVHAKGEAYDISERSSRNSQVVSCSGIADSTVVALNGNDNDVAAAMMMVSSDANVKEGSKGFRDSSSNGQDETSLSKSKKGAIPTERSAGAKRAQSACMEIDGSAVNTGKKLVPESHPAEAIPHKHDQGETSHSKSKKLAIPTERIASAKRAQNAYTEIDGSVVNTGKKLVPESGPAEVIPHKHDDAASAEHRADSPKKVPISTVRNTVTRRTQNALTKMYDAQAPPNLEEISQENKLKPTKVSDTANGGEGRNNPPKKLSNTRVRNTAAKKSQKSITNISKALGSKTETMAAGSLFDDLFPEDNVEDCPKMLSSSASASDCGTLPPKNVLNPRVRNAVPKRKMKDLEHKIESKRGKVGSAIASVAKAVSSKRIKEMSCNFNKVTAEQSFEKDNKDGMRDVSGLFCQDSGTVDKSEGVHNSKVRSSKCNKVLTSNHEKENKQDHSNLDSKSNARTGSLYSKSDAKSMTKDEDVFGKHRGVKGNESRTLIMSEPALFILSGNRQQRANYRSILRHLKGRVCRDSHHWSYQATHFIAPEPLRRTEKFFAAAAAGRWILKSDYLTSCMEAGKFLDEEPFELFGTGLSDGEKISLEAPRKWRILRQQMRHGAFYGMQIVVYGQLILPTLDTMKRAVQAGDGTILATSPPYTRFLESGVDFAVVSGSIPSADAWVQEFIQHGIPCVTADYLVEYVCKAGHPLDSHVLFKTNDLANRSLEKLMKNQQEAATDEAEQSDDEDLSCSVCGRKDRGDVMLICGDEDGTAGCGIGMHIDCCDPPLDAVPDDDWLCNNCNVPKTKAKPARSTGRKLRPSKEI